MLLDNAGPYRPFVGPRIRSSAARLELGVADAAIVRQGGSPRKASPLRLGPAAALPLRRPTFSSNKHAESRSPDPNSPVDRLPLFA